MHLKKIQYSMLLSSVWFFSLVARSDDISYYKSQLETILALKRSQLRQRSNAEKFQELTLLKSAQSHINEQLQKSENKKADRYDLGRIYQLQAMINTLARDYNIDSTENLCSGEETLHICKVEELAKMEHNVERLYYLEDARNGLKRSEKSGWIEWYLGPWIDLYPATVDACQNAVSTFNEHCVSLDNKKDVLSDEEKKACEECQALRETINDLVERYKIVLATKMKETALK